MKNRNEMTVDEKSEQIGQTLGSTRARETSLRPAGFSGEKRSLPHVRGFNETTIGQELFAQWIGIQDSPNPKFKDRKMLLLKDQDGIEFLMPFYSTLKRNAEIKGSKGLNFEEDEGKWIYLKHVGMNESKDFDNDYPVFHYEVGEYQE